jgi:sarcosine oxidase, subunit alpha
MNRIQRHPILSIPIRESITIYWKGLSLQAYQGETIAAALIASGIRVFNHHHLDGSPQGIFCANGQCSQCMVLVNGYPLKSCMELVSPNMKVEPVYGLPKLPEANNPAHFSDPLEVNIPVLIIGGGPAGLSAAIELSKSGVHSLLIDDKHRLGGKLVLQTHRFFGSTSEVYAGTRGIDIATRLENELRSLQRCEIWLNSTALAIFEDKKIAVLKDGKYYVLISPQVLLLATGARELFLAFPGNTLPGVYGAGAFQTLINRDLIRPAEKLFIIGGGNVGLIAGYHALQAGIKVIGLAEFQPECGGYKVHKDKLARMGVPIFTSHTVISANGKTGVESITIGEVNAEFKPISGSEKTFRCDSLLIAVGLEPVNEFSQKARDFGLSVYSAGDAEEIAEGSAAIMTGQIRGREIARTWGSTSEVIPTEWYRNREILKSRPGKTIISSGDESIGQVMPIIHCSQEIPCNPCAMICPSGLIHIDQDDIRKLPVFRPEAKNCTGCELCLTFCPGLAITLVDYRRDAQYPFVSIPFEFDLEWIKDKHTLPAMDTEGTLLGEFELTRIKKITNRDRTLIVQLRAPREIARNIAGIRVEEFDHNDEIHTFQEPISGDAIICRCERVSAEQIQKLIHLGYRDINEIKAITHATMGACGSKTCRALIHRLFKAEGIPLAEVTNVTHRPIFVEVPLKTFAGIHHPDE